MCFSILSCPGGLEGSAVKIHKMFFCKAFPDIHLGRFQRLDGLLCQKVCLILVSPPGMHSGHEWHLNLGTEAGNVLRSGKEEKHLVLRLPNRPHSFVRQIKSYMELYVTSKSWSIETFCQNCKRKTKKEIWWTFPVFNPSTSCFPLLFRLIFTGVKSLFPHCVKISRL